MSGAALWQCFNANDVGQFSQELDNAMPASLRNFFKGFFYNGRTNLIVSSPLGYRTRNGALEFHHGTDLQPASANGYPYIGVVRGLLLTHIGFQRRINNTTYLSPNSGKASGYGWYAIFQPQEAAVNDDAKKWFLLFAHLEAPPFSLKTNLPAGYSIVKNGTLSCKLSYPAEHQKPVDRSSANTEYMKAIRKIILATANGYDSRDKNSETSILTYEGGKVYEYTSITYKEFEEIDKSSPLVAEFDGIETGKYPIGFTYASRKDTIYNYNSVAEQNIALIMGSTGMSQAVHYHVNFVYNCYYLDVLEAIKEDTDRPRISEIATRGC